MKKTHGKGHTRKHAAGKGRKHQATSKHHPKHQLKPPIIITGSVNNTVARHPHHPKPRGLAVGDALPVCSLEAVAQSLRLAGRRVSDDDVAGLWEACGRRELTIPEALAAFGEVAPGGRWQPLVPGPGQGFSPALIQPLSIAQPGEAIPPGLPMVLGVNLPGPHAVLATPDGWWSWGELYSPSAFPGAVIEEAWAVSWS